MRGILLFSALVISGLSGTPLTPPVPLVPQPRSAILVPPTREALSGAEERNSNVCGIRRSSVPDLFSRIVGGSPAEKHEFPWQISLQWRFNWYTYHVCGAAIINQNWVVTAAHCTHQFKPKDLLVVAGDHQMKFKEGTEQTRYLERIVEHSSYNSNTQQNDIALLKLSTPLTLDGVTASPVCVPPFNTGFSGHCLVTGWGKLKENGDNSDRLQKVIVPIINNQQCQQSYRNIGYTGPIADGMICAGYSAGGRDACQGDSGGPFVCSGPDNRYYLAGIVSWGIGCARPGVPGVYTEVSHYVDWISNVINNRIENPVRPVSRVSTFYDARQQEIAQGTQQKEEEEEEEEEETLQEEKEEEEEETQKEAMEENRKQEEYMQQVTTAQQKQQTFQQGFWEGEERALSSEEEGSTEQGQDSGIETGHSEHMTENPFIVA